MQELTEIRFHENRVVFENNLVKSSVLPRLSSELERDVVVKGNCTIAGAVYARNFEVEQGPLCVEGAVFTQLELHVNSDAKETVVFRKSVGSAGAIVSHAPGCRLQFLADLNAKQVRLRNAYVAGSIFADEATIENCAVVGGVFATRSLDMTNCIVGTFNSPSVRAAQSIYLLLPAGFTVEGIAAPPGTELFSLALADLGALMRGVPEAPESGKIRIDIQKDEQRTVLTDGDAQQVLRSYSIAGKVLAADMLNIEKLQNHFLLSAASLGGQLLQTYDLGFDAQGDPVALTPDRISGFLFDILDGRTPISSLSASFKLSDLVVPFQSSASQ